ncbi:type II toxin-antitoxin system HicB family antitoxin [Lentisphaerota bacterium ZTH]|nr:type II toxin-antitoxin system HicB family antitoxin [Lentisphaerota bacterium]WET05532.1 type II toxin-antitoxin system HicB family antitoxin [Lentisphaerota bacterium ZTH]
MKKVYTALLHGVDEEGDVGVTFPDFPGCISQGENVDEALRKGREALEFHLEGMLEEKLPIPEVSSRTEVVKAVKECEESVYPSLIEVEMPETQKERINVTISRYKLNKIDTYAKSHHLKRSAFLEQAAMDYISTHH